MRLAAGSLRESGPCAEKNSIRPEYAHAVLVLEDTASSTSTSTISLSTSTIKAKTAQLQKRWLRVNRLFVSRIGFRRTRTQRSGTQRSGTRTRWLFELQRCRSLMEAVRGNLQTNVPNCYAGSLQVREEVRTIRAIALELKAPLKASCRAPACPTLDNRLESRRQTLDPKTRACPRSLARLAADAASPIPSLYPT